MSVPVLVDVWQLTCSSIRYDPESKLMDLADSSSQLLNIPHLPHKRTLSAPDFKAQLLQSRRPGSSSPRSIGQRSELTPPCSSHPDQASPKLAHFTVGPDTPPEVLAQQKISEPRCMYIEDCDTNSTPRKAISHLLGRNKMCTRLIPAHVWVQYCRKHYQRARYRNMGGWPPLQCELVQEQIKRLEVWSKDNTKRGDGPVVKDWTLALRKREQSRRDRLAKIAAKGAAGDSKEESDAEIDDISPVRGDRSDNPPQAVPEWLLEMVGSGYSSAEISSIFDRIHNAILNKELPNMPDIEILPNIIVDREALGPKEAKGYVKRKFIGGSHQRSQSLGGANLHLTDGWTGSGPRRGSSQSLVWGTGIYGADNMSPSQKRKRHDGYDDEGYFPSSVVASNHRHRTSPFEALSNRPVGPTRTYSGWMDGPQHMVHHPLPQHMQGQYRQHFISVDDMNVRTDFLQQQSHILQQQQHHHHMQPHHAYNQRTSTPVTYASPIVAPQPLRQPYVSTAQHLDTEIGGRLPVVGFGMRRTMHQRSRSDVSYLRRDDGHNSFAGQSGC